MSEPAYQVVFFTGILVGVAIDRLHELNWRVVSAEHEGFEAVTPSGMRLRVRVEEIK